MLGCIRLISSPLCSFQKSQQLEATIDVGIGATQSSQRQNDRFMDPGGVMCLSVRIESWVGLEMVLTCIGIASHFIVTDQFHGFTTASLRLFQPFPPLVLLCYKLDTPCKDADVVEQIWL